QRWTRWHSRDRRLVRGMGLSLRQARLCLDCDCLTDDLCCPWCGRDGTVPLAGWFHPMDDGKPDATRREPTPQPPDRRWTLIVHHSHRELYGVLRRGLAGPGVAAHYEGRGSERRRRPPPPAAEERRRSDRRRARPRAILYQDATPRGDGERARADGTT